MSLYGNYFKQQEEIVTINLPAYKRLMDIPYLIFETDSMLCAAQEQGLATYYVCAKIWKIHNNNM